MTVPEDHGRGNLVTLNAFGLATWRSPHRPALIAVIIRYVTQEVIAKSTVSARDNGIRETDAHDAKNLASIMHVYQFSCSKKTGK